MKSLFAHQKHSILLITSESIARVDLCAGKLPTVLAAHTAPRPEFTELATAVGQALALGQSQRGKVWIFTDQLWSGRVALPADVVHAVAPAQLTQTLALEAEYDSGISPFTSLTSQLASQESSPVKSLAERSWWVTQVDQAQYESIIAAFPKWAGSLAGLAAFSDAPKEFSLHLPSLPVGPVHQLTASELGEIATQWHALATARPARIPVIHPPQRGIDRQRQQQLSLVGAALAVLLCIAHFAATRTQQTDLSLSLTELSAHETQLKKQIDQLDRTVRSTEADAKLENAKREAETQRTVETRRRVTEHDAARRFPSFLLQALSTTAYPEHHLSKIELGRDRVTLSGIALNGSSVAKLAQDLDQQLAAVAWRVQPPELSAAGLGSLVSFKLTLLSSPATKTNITARRQGSLHVH